MNNHDHFHFNVEESEKNFVYSNSDNTYDQLSENQKITKLKEIKERFFRSILFNSEEENKKIEKFIYVEYSEDHKEIISKKIINEDNYDRLDYFRYVEMNFKNLIEKENFEDLNNDENKSTTMSSSSKPFFINHDNLFVYLISSLIDKYPNLKFLEDSFNQEKVKKNSNSKEEKEISDELNKVSIEVESVENEVSMNGYEYCINYGKKALETDGNINMDFKAIKILEYLSKTTKNEEVYILLSNLTYKISEKTISKKYADMCLEINNKNKYAYLILGKIEYSHYLKGRNINNLIQAEDYFDKAIEIDELFWDALRRKADCLDDNGKCEEALKLYNLIIEKNENCDAEIYNSRGIVLKNLEKYSEAIQDLKKCLSLNSKNVDKQRHYNNLISFYLDDDKYDEAYPICKEAHKLFKTNPKILSNLTFTADKLGLKDYNETVVVQNYKDCIQNDSTIPWFYLRLARFYIKINKKNGEIKYKLEEIIENFIKAIDLNPENFETYEEAFCIDQEITKNQIINLIKKEKDNINNEKDLNKLKANKFKLEQFEKNLSKLEELEKWNKV